MSKARNFFTEVVLPTVEEYSVAIVDTRRARLAAIVLYHMADYWQLENSAAFQKISSAHEHLISVCPEFLIIRDVADATKHCELGIAGKIDRVLKNADQVSATMAPGLFEAPFGMGSFAEALQVVATLDDGRSVHIAPVVQAVLAMWKTIYP